MKTKILYTIVAEAEMDLEGMDDLAIEAVGESIAKHGTLNYGPSETTKVALKSICADVSFQKTILSEK